MTQEDVKRHLNRIRRQEYLMRSMEREMVQVRADMVSLQAAPLGGRVSGSKTSDMADRYIKLEQYEQRVGRAWDRLIVLREQGKGRIQLIEDPVMQAVLYDRYINCLSWESIAVGTGYTYRRVLQLHGSALIELTDKLNLVQRMMAVVRKRFPSISH
jgi:hypothetical protein